MNKEINQTLWQSEHLVWNDAISPSKKYLQDLAKTLNLPESTVQNCLNSDYLPQVQSYGDVQFIILRLPEPQSVIHADTVQELTTKIAFFIVDNQVYTVHRLDLALINQVLDKIKQNDPTKQVVANKQNETTQQTEFVSLITPNLLLKFFFELIAVSFDDGLNQLEQSMEQFEEKIFQSKRSKALLKEGYYIKRKASSYKKVLKFTFDVINKTAIKSNLSIFTEQKEIIERHVFYADDIFENTQGLLALHLSIASQRTNEASLRTNEIMRVLTVLTIFFLPLNFIVGLFGMNFSYIPLLQTEHGFWLSVAFMIFISVALLYYLIKKGWLSEISITGPNDQHTRK